MADKRPNKERKRDQGAWRVLERHYGKLILAALLVSILLHTVSVVELSRVESDRKLFNLNQSKKPPVKFRVVQVPQKKKPDDQVEPPTLPKILETPQAQTQKPDKADYVGNVNHETKKETKVSEKVKREKAKDPGQKGKPDSKEAPTKVAQEQQNQPKPQKSPKQSDQKVKSKVGQLAMDSYNPKPRNDYEALLPTSIRDLPGQVDAGYQDYIDDKIDEGDRIDINTSEYRYIGYFTSMRKAIELVWIYPMDAARRGMQGEVGLEFAITKDGHATHIRVIKSSGYEVLDRAIIEAIKLASPFSPLPEGFKRNRLVVTGSFRYILNSYGSH